jgi:hypothetical protein
MKPRDQREHLMLVPPTCARLWTAEETSQFLSIPVSTLHQWRYFAKVRAHSGSGVTCDTTLTWCDSGWSSSASVRRAEPWLAT